MQLSMVSNNGVIPLRNYCVIVISARRARVRPAAVRGQGSMAAAHFRFLAVYIVQCVAYVDVHATTNTAAITTLKFVWSHNVHC